MKKLSDISLVLLLGLTSLSSISAGKGVKSEVVDPQMPELAALLTEYATESKNQYTKKTEIYIDRSVEGFDANYFHAQVSQQQRTTYYTKGALLMGDMNGGFTYINSGYANDGAGNMNHFYAKDNSGLAALTDESLRQVDYSVKGKTMKDYFFDLNDLADIVNESDASKWTVANGTYTYNIGTLTFDDNGDYEDIVLKAFQYFAAPMLLMHKQGDSSHYLSPSSIEVKENGGYLYIKLFAASDSGKLYGNEKAQGLLARACVYKGLILPGFYLTGDFANWDILPENKMGTGDDDYYAISTNFKIANKDYEAKVVHVLDDGYTYWHGGAYGNIKFSHDGLYNFRVSKSDGLVDFTFVQPITFEVYWGDNGDKMYGRVFVYLFNDKDSTHITENQAWPGQLLTTFDKTGNNYVINADGYNKVIFSCYETNEDAKLAQTADINISSITNGGLTIHSGSDWIWTKTW